MSASNRTAPPRWTRPPNARRRLASLTADVVAVALCLSLPWITLGDADARVIWTAVLLFYCIFYQRLARIVYWSNATYRDLKTTLGAPADDLHAHESNMPTFHILIASYEASASIEPVLRAVANLHYPKERYHAWVITERGEHLSTLARREAAVEKVLTQEEHGDADPSVLAMAWRRESERVPDWSAWVESVRSGSLRAFLGFPELTGVVVHDLLFRLLRQPGRTYSLAALRDLGFSTREIRFVEAVLDRIENRTNRIITDFDRLLGSPAIYRREDVEFELIRRSVERPRMRVLARRLGRRLGTREGPISIGQERIARVAEQMLPSTQDVVRRVIEECPGVNLHHLDPHNRGFKPGALNRAYRTIEDAGYLRTPRDVFFVIIDSDSLLPRHALQAVARELEAAGSPSPIMQMASVPTANFFSCGWFSRFISVADAIGAVGKWSRSTRLQLRPDLHAGSGVVIPATVTAYLSERQGDPWTETTLTEDARMIVGQFGMMNGVRNTTRMAPCYLLEAVPADWSFLRTYGSFWSQRRRWTTGGYDELLYMLAAPTWLRHAYYDAKRDCWRSETPETTERRSSRRRQASRVALWTWDHFWWGIGGAMIFTHWWLVSVAIIAPSPVISWIGLALLLAGPLVFLCTTGRQLDSFVPGGFQAGDRIGFYFQSFFSIWLYCLPVVVTQIACVSGFRSKFLEWKPTKKPRYHLYSRAPVAGDRAGAEPIVTGSPSSR